jgi:hypothetical protein
MIYIEYSFYNSILTSFNVLTSLITVGIVYKTYYLTNNLIKNLEKKIEEFLYSENSDSSEVDF